MGCALEIKWCESLFEVLDLFIELVPGHLTNLDQGSVYCLELLWEKLNIFLDVLVQVVLHEQLTRLGEQAPHCTGHYLHRHEQLAWLIGVCRVSCL